MIELIGKSLCNSKGFVTKLYQEYIRDLKLGLSALLCGPIPGAYAPSSTPNPKEDNYAICRGLIHSLSGLARGRSLHEKANHKHTAAGPSPVFKAAMVANHGINGC